MQGVAGVTLLWGGSGIPPIPAGTPVPANLTSVTDANGSYQVQLPDAASYSVSADAVFPMSVVRPIGSLDIINFYVNTGGCPTQYGRIVDVMTRRVIAGAHVSWVGVTSTSDLTGNYRLTLACRPGGYGSGPTTLSVSHPGYQPVLGARPKRRDPRRRPRGVAPRHRADAAMSSEQRNKATATTRRTRRPHEDGHD